MSWRPRKTAQVSGLRTQTWTWTQKNSVILPNSNLNSKKLNFRTRTCWNGLNSNLKLNTNRSSSQPWLQHLWIRSSKIFSFYIKITLHCLQVQLSNESSLSGKDIILFYTGYLTNGILHAWQKCSTTLTPKPKVMGTPSLISRLMFTEFFFGKTGS